MLPNGSVERKNEELVNECWGRRTVLLPRRPVPHRSRLPFTSCLESFMSFMSRAFTPFAFDVNGISSPIRNHNNHTLTHNNSHNSVLPFSNAHNFPSATYKALAKNPQNKVFRTTLPPLSARQRLSSSRTLLFSHFSATFRSSTL